LTRLIFHKLVHIAWVLLIVTFGLTFLLDLTPGDPAYAIFGIQATPEQVAQIREDLKLGEPFYTRYWDWLSNVLQGDFGTSYRTRERVTDIIIARLPVTGELIVLALLMALLVSLPIGVYTAYRTDGKFDRIWKLLSSTIVSIPPFVSALLLVFLFSLQLPYFPVTGWTKFGDGVLDNLRHAFLPALTLALVEIPAYTRVLRADMIATLQEDYILAARAKGIPTGRILFRHALRPSSFSLVTLAALSTGRLIGGSVIVETLFALPGLGQLIIFNVLAKDVIIVQGIVMFIAIMYIFMNAVTDIAYAYLDPRLRTRAT
jgi:peptide/nickel transport system permease protein